MNRLTDSALDLRDRLDGVGHWLAPLGLRLILAWEFWEAGIEKLRGENWFGGIQSQFPFPLNIVPADLSWTMATWAELLGALALLFGLGTRFFAFSLFVLTVVATAAVHWPAEWNSLGELWQGYAIRDTGHGNFKLPLLFALMLLPLILHGPGRLSLDALIVRMLGHRSEQPGGGALGWGLVLLVSGLPLLMLLPAVGLAAVVLGLALLIAHRFARA
ncbi:DoxX family protein [Rehaibacterium terrae]|jgi:putative oxidoreductase|uniref:Putative oxidoreductase n=1 Tax=Rehaibacterium terrae TaxID=1341696 RepID=A0A7W7Y0G4_9GAMM|nr:DoxX family protein [Rehaibacterium terrae]MBB5015628.1 putative oxidoreductase [Rehaibacterium terrae]